MLLIMVPIVLAASFTPDFMFSGTLVSQQGSSLHALNVTFLPGSSVTVVVVQDPGSSSQVTVPVAQYGDSLDGIPTLNPATPAFDNDCVWYY